MGSLSVGLGNSTTTERPENALDALLDELQTFARPCDTQSDTADDSSCSVPTTDNPSDDNKGHISRVTTQLSQNLLYEDRREANAPDGSSDVRKGSMDSALPPAHNTSHTLSVNTGSLRRLHSYPSGSDTDNSPPIHPPVRAAKPPVPERNAELLSQLTGRRVPPPPPPRTSSRSPLASPTSPHLPPRAPVQEGGTLRRNTPNRSSLKDKCQTLPRNIGASPAVLSAAPINDCSLNALLPNSNSSSCESVNSQDGTKKSGNRQQQLEQRHQELLKKQKALQEQYARLQQIQRGSSALTVVPPAPDLLLKKTGSESNLLVKMNLNMAPAFSGSLTHLANSNNIVVTTATTGGGTGGDISDGSTNSAATTTTISSSTTSKVYETDIL